MSTLLVKNADIIITLDPKDRKIHGGGIFVKDNVIEQIGPLEELPGQADEVIDATGMAILPGLVNTHHHTFQSLFRAIPSCQNEELFTWQVRLLPLFGEMTNEAVYTATLTAMAEMILSGCTTSSDHLYAYPNNVRMDAQVKAAKEIGMRYHVTRGSLSMGKSKGGLPPDSIVEDEEHIIKDSQRVIETYHDPSPMAMIRVGLAPCTPWSVTKNLMRETAKLARSYKKVMLHTHVAEVRDEEVYCLKYFNQRPVEYMVDVGWTGPDVWWAHSIFVNSDEIKMMAETGTGVAHCPSSNMRLGSGICQVREMLDAGVKVGIGVDGSASNDSGHVFNEARLALLLQRVKHGAGIFSVLEALRLATQGGAAVLGRADEIGTLEKGKAADFVGINLHTIAMAGGAVHDPVAALLLCAIDRVELSVINGKVIVSQGKLMTIDVDKLIERHNHIAKEIASRHPELDKISLK